MVCLSGRLYVAGQKCLVIFSDCAPFQRLADIGLPPEVLSLKSIAASRHLNSLFILSDFIWNLSGENKLSRWIKAPRAFMISVSRDSMLLVDKPEIGSDTLMLYNLNGTMYKKFIFPPVYSDMKISQAELTTNGSIVVSISAYNKQNVLEITQAGIAVRLYDSLLSEPLLEGRNLFPNSCIHCEQFIALNETNYQVFATVSYPPFTTPVVQPGLASLEKVILLDENLQVNQIILPDMQPRFKNYSKICYDSDRNHLIVICAKKCDDEYENGSYYTALTRVANVYSVQYTGIVP